MKHVMIIHIVHQDAILGLPGFVSYENYSRPVIFLNEACA